MPHRDMTTTGSAPLLRPTRKGLMFRKCYELPSIVVILFIIVALSTLSGFVYWGITRLQPGQDGLGYLFYGVSLLITLLFFLLPAASFAAGFIADPKSKTLKLTGLPLLHRRRSTYLADAVGVGLKTEKITQHNSTGFYDEFTRYRLYFHFADGHDEEAITSLDKKKVNQLQHEMAQAFGIPVLELVEIKFEKAKPIILKKADKPPRREQKPPTF